MALSDRLIRRLLNLIMILTLVCVAISLSLSVISFSKNPYNEERIAASLALGRGLNIFPIKADGPLLSVLYGPVFYLLYYPVTLFRHAATILTVGTVWSLALYSMPILFLAWEDRRAAPITRLLTPLCFFTLSLSSYWERSAMLAIHPDAAACGLSGLGLVLATFSRLTNLRIAFGALCCIAAIGCKQNSAFALFLFLVVLWWRGPYWFKKALQFSVVALVVLLLVVYVSYKGLGGIWLNNWIIPGRSGLEWSKSTAALLSLYQSILLPSLFLVLLASNDISAMRNGRWRYELFAFSVVLVVASTVVCFPAYLFPGGAGNAFSPSITALILLPTVWLRSQLIKSRADGLENITAVWLSLFLCLVAVSTMSLSVRAPELHETFRESSASIVERYCALHPGEIYFPFNPVAVYRGEGHIYSSDWGVENRSRAGFVPSYSEFRAAIPESPHYLAYPIPPGSGPGYLLKTYWPHAHQIEQSDLPGFFIYEIDPAAGNR